MRRRRASRAALRRAAGEERGVVLVIVCICMVVMIGLVAMVVDVGLWYSTQRQAQAAADAAALAGAQDLPSSQSTATSDANSYVAKNISGSTPSISFPQSDQIKVTVSVTAPLLFGKIFGMSAPTVSASATATSNTTPILDPIYADSTACNAVTFTGLNNGVQMGGLDTNGGIDFGGSNSATVSSVDYSSTCGAPSHVAGVVIQSSTVNTSTHTFPIDYRTQLSQITCNGNGGTVTYSGGTYSYSQSSLTLTNNQTLNGVYCAQTINLTNSMVLNGTATFIADNFGGGGVSDTGTLTPAYNHLLLWQTGTSQLQINSTTFVNGNVIFAPSAQIYLNTNAITGGAQTALLEGDTVEIVGMNGGSFNVPSGLTTGTNSAALTQ